METGATRQRTEGELVKRILIVEDEYLIALDLAEGVRQLGCDVLGPVGRVDAAMDLVEAKPDIDAALLDVNLNGERVFPVADRLIARDVPVVLMTGYDESTIPGRYASINSFTKPVTRAMLCDALATLSPS